MQEKFRTQVLPCFSPRIRDILAQLPHQHVGQLEEVRLRIGKPLALQLHQGCLYVTGDGSLTREAEKAYQVDRNDMERTLAAVSGNSIYALEEELKRGFITVMGGHRVGLAGKTVLEKGEIKTMTDFTGIAFRVAREVPGCARELIGRITDSDGLPLNTLILSPPRCGKTTVLRDLALSYSRGIKGKGINVAVVDERSEIAGCYQGEPQLDVGPRTDVLEGCPKAMGVIMAIRALAPNLIITDEIGRPEDAEAIQECLNAGVRIITSIHGGSWDEVMARPVFQHIWRQNCFQAVVTMSRRKGPGTVEHIMIPDRARGEAYDYQSDRRGLDHRGERMGRLAEGLGSFPENQEPASSQK